MALYQALTCKRRGDDQCSEMLTVTIHFEMCALQSGGDVVLDQIRCG
jgi:hypothetical protein